MDIATINDREVVEDNDDDTDSYSSVSTSAETEVGSVDWPDFLIDPDSPSGAVTVLDNCDGDVEDEGETTPDTVAADDANENKQAEVSNDNMVDTVTENMDLESVCASASAESLKDIRAAPSTNTQDQLQQNSLEVEMESVESQVQEIQKDPDLNQITLMDDQECKSLLSRLDAAGVGDGVSVSSEEEAKPPPPPPSTSERDVGLTSNILKTKNNNIPRKSLSSISIPERRIASVSPMNMNSAEEDDIMLMLNGGNRNLRRIPRITDPLRMRQKEKLQKQAIEGMINIRAQFDLSQLSMPKASSNGIPESSTKELGGEASSTSGSDTDSSSESEDEDAKKKQVRQDENDSDSTEVSDLDEDEYVVEDIVRKRKIDGEVQYLIKWKNWSPRFNTWEPVENLIHCRDLLDEFEKTSEYGKKPMERVCPEPTQEEAEVNKVMLKDCADFIKDLGIYATWPMSKVPESVEGAIVIDGHLTYVVKRRTKKRMDRLTERNVIPVYSSGFRHKYPQLLIQFFETRIGWATKPSKADADLFTIFGKPGVNVKDVIEEMDVSD